MEINRWISEMLGNIFISDYMMKCGTTNTVYVYFIVEKNGSLSGVQITKTNCKPMKPKECSKVCTAIEAECLRVVKSMPKWNPATMDEKPVRMSYTLPIKLMLN